MARHDFRALAFIALLILASLLYGVRIAWAPANSFAFKSQLKFDGNFSAWAKNSQGSWTFGIVGSIYCDEDFAWAQAGQTRINESFAFFKLDPSTGAATQKVGTWNRSFITNIPTFGGSQGLACSNYSWDAPPYPFTFQRIFVYNETAFLLVAHIMAGYAYCSGCGSHGDFPFFWAQLFNVKDLGGGSYAITQRNSSLFSCATCGGSWTITQDAFLAVGSPISTVWVAIFQSGFSGFNIRQAAGIFSFSVSSFTWATGPVATASSPMGIAISPPDGGNFQGIAFMGIDPSNTNHIYFFIQDAALIQNVVVRFDVSSNTATFVSFSAGWGPDNYIDNLFAFNTGDSYPQTRSWDRQYRAVSSLHDNDGVKLTVKLYGLDNRTIPNAALPPEHTCYKLYTIPVSFSGSILVNTRVCLANDPIPAGYYDMGNNVYYFWAFNPISSSAFGVRWDDVAGSAQSVSPNPAQTPSGAWAHVQGGDIFFGDPNVFYWTGANDVGPTTSSTTSTGGGGGGGTGADLYLNPVINMFAILGLLFGPCALLAYYVGAGGCLAGLGMGFIAGVLSGLIPFWAILVIVLIMITVLFVGRGRLFGGARE